MARVRPVLLAPLAGLRMNLAALARAGVSAELVAAASVDVGRLTALVDRLGALPAEETPRLHERTQVDLSAVFREAVAALRTRHPRVEVDLALPRSGPLFSGDPVALRLMADSLLENVAQHAGPTARAQVTFYDSAGRISFTVDDDGPGFRAGSLDVARGRGGGLDVAVSVTERHGGELQLGVSPTGGVRVAVHFVRRSG